MASHATQRKKGGLYVALSARIAIPVGRRGEVPTEFRIFRKGENPSEKGTFVFDDAAALSVMAEYLAHGKPMQFDYNHGTTFETPTPEQAISAGKFIPEIRDGELWATKCDWTERAKAYLTAAEYELFSPFFTHTKELRVRRLVNVALTNLPALDNIESLVAANANAQHEEPDMEPCTACTALNARLTAIDEECKALRAKLSMFEKDKADEQTKATALRLDIAKLTGEENLPAALGVIAALKTKADGYDKLAAEKAALETSTLSAEITAALDAGSKEGKVPPGEREGLEKAALAFGGGKPSKDGIAWLNALIKTKAKVVAAEPTKQGSGPVALTESQIAIAKLCGVSLDDRSKFETERLSAGR